MTDEEIAALADPDRLEQFCKDYHKRIRVVWPVMWEGKQIDALTFLDGIDLTIGNDLDPAKVFCKLYGRRYDGPDDYQALLFDTAEESRADRLKAVPYRWSGHCWQRNFGEGLLDFFGPVRNFLNFLTEQMDAVLCDLALMERQVGERTDLKAYAYIDVLSLSKEKKTVKQEKELTDLNPFQKIGESLRAQKAVFRDAAEGKYKKAKSCFPILEAACSMRGLGFNSSKEDGGWDSAHEIRFRIPCENGVFVPNNASGMLYHGKPSDRYLMRANVSYIHDADSSIFENFILSIMGNRKELVDYLQVVLGAILCRGDKPIFLCCYGATGNNGKTTFFNFLHKILGGLIGSLDVGLILTGMISSPNGPSPATMALRGKALMTVEELNENAVLDMGVLKRVLAGSTLTGRPLYGSQVTFKSCACLALATNFRPTLNSFDGGTRRRLALIPFEVKFVEPDKVRAMGLDPDAKDTPEILARQGYALEDPQMMVKLNTQEGREGAFRWLCDGAVKFCQRGYTLPEQPSVVSQATAEWIDDSDIIKLFMNDCLIPSEHGRIEATELFNLYRTWATSVGIKNPGKQTLFGNRIKIHLERDKDAKTRRFVYLGVALSDRGRQLQGPSFSAGWQ